LYSRDANDNELQAAEHAASSAVSAAVPETVAAGAAGGVRLLGRLAFAGRLHAAEYRQADWRQQRRQYADHQEGDKRRLKAQRLQRDEN